MSFESLIDDEPRANVKRPALENETDEAGLPIHGLVDVIIGVPGRLFAANASQMNAWLALGVQATYNYVTSERGIENGNFLEVDGRLFRVMGVNRKTMGKGAIPDIWEYPLAEASR